MRRILDLPLIVILMGIGALAMYVPAAHALVLGEHEVARAFFYSGTLFLVLTALIAVVTADYRPSNAAKSHLLTLVAAYLALPLMMAVPLREALGDTTLLRAWFEMVSSFTTTGATVYDTPGRLAAPLHLWRGLVGWMGGFFVLLTSLAILAPLRLGGFEVSGTGPPGADDASAAAPTPSLRLARTAVVLLPPYVLLTGGLWVALLIAGDPALVALMHAMATLATSGISPLPAGPSGASSGLPGEALILLMMAFALSRHLFPATAPGTARRPPAQDAELRLALVIVAGVPLILFLRHWLGALDAPAAGGASLIDAAHALWGGVFTVASFLTTIGFVSADWADARLWSGVPAPGLILVGLAMVGGGVATTAGGVKLLRVFALYVHGVREMEKLVHPSSLGGSGPAARRLRRQGAFAAWVFFMLYATSIAAVMGLLALFGVAFVPSLVFTISALSTTGPLATVATEVPLSYAALGPGAQVVLALAMVLGRLEMLAIIALMAPDMWRR